jgi:Putative Ig domain/Matrixin
MNPLARFFYRHAQRKAPTTHKRCYPKIEILEDRSVPSNVPASTLAIDITGSTVTQSSNNITATATLGTSGNFTATATGSPTPTLALLSTSPALPRGMGYNSNSGRLSWPGNLSFTSLGDYTLTFQASNSSASPVTQIVTFVVTSTSPQMPSTGSATFTLGTPGSYQVTATGTPAPTFSVPSGSLPTGVNLSSSGLLTSTALTPGGTYNFTITATNGVAPDATESFTLTVDQAVHFTSKSSTGFTVGNLGSYQVTASGSPAPTFAVTGGTLPSTVNLSSTGLLSGTPTDAGTYNFTITATSSAGTATQNFTLTVSAQSAINISGNTVTQNGNNITATVTLGTSGNFSVTATGSPTPSLTLLSSSPALPGGFGFNANLGNFYWPADLSANTAGNYTLTFQANNGVDAPVQQTVLLQIQGTTGTAPTIAGPDTTSSTPVLAALGTAGHFNVTVTGGTPSATLTLTSSPALPNGLAFNPNNGKFSWPGNLSASLAGNLYTLTFTADNGVSPDATLVVYWQIANPQLLAGPANTNPNAKSLTQAQLKPIVNAAIKLWQKAGISSIQTALLRSASITIGNLQGTGELADTANGKIVIDATADGDGWYIDKSPLANKGFTRITGTSQYVAKSGPASKEVDLLTVVMHEMGHILGLSDLDPSLYPNQLMTETLGVGIRRLPSTYSVS